MSNTADSRFSFHTELTLFRPYPCISNDDTSFACAECGRTFRNRRARDRHENLHLEKKKFVCYGSLKDGIPWGCGRSFDGAESLGCHLQSRFGLKCMKPLLDDEASENFRRGQVHPITSEPQSWGFKWPACLLAQHPSLVEFIEDQPDLLNGNAYGSGARLLCELGDRTARRFAHIFARHLAYGSGSRTWGQSALERLGHEGLIFRLDMILTNYFPDSLNTGHTRHPPSLWKGVWRRSREICFHFCEEIKWHCLSPETRSSRPKVIESTDILLEQIPRTHTDFSNPKGISRQMDKLLLTSYILDNTLKLDYAFISNKGFDSLSLLVRETLYSTPGCSMNRIKGAWRAANTHLLSTDDSLFGTLTHIVREASEVAIETNLSLLHFIKHNFSEQRIELSTLITITGTAFYAYATTCLEYLKEIWPNSGETLLPILQKAIREILDRPDSEARVDTEHDLFYRISVELYQDGTLKLRTKGPEAFVVDIIQQLCWLNSTFSMLPPGQDGTGYCTPVIDPICGSDQDVPIIRLGTSFTKLLTDEKRSCWLSLFSNVVIAHGFPIPKREIGIGLEMSLELMAAIIGARHAAIFDGGVVVKGFSSMFLPVKKACGEIQWHYVANYDPDMWLSYDEGVKRCSNRSLLRDINLDSLKTARCFIGWNSLVEIRIGDESNNFNDVEFSDAKEVKSVLQIPSASVGFQQFALAQVNVTFGKRDGKCHFQRSSSYRRIISASESMFIVLFDTAERRSYLVAASGLLLHILRHRISLGLGGIPASKIRIPSAVNITKTLLQNAKLQVSPEEDESLLVGNVVSEIWSVLELLQAQIIHSEKNTNLEIHATWQERLLGYEYMSVVRDWSPMPLKELEVHKSCGGWPRLARDINALVLLGSGFGDLIRPIDDQEILCHQWKSLPRDRDYMAIPVKVLLALYSSAGCRQTKKRLTSTDLQLHSEGVSFQACPTPKEWQCSCDRLQQVISNSSFGHICVPELIEGSGAVIIGESKSLLKRFAISTLKFTGIPSLTHNTLDSEITANLNSDTPGSSCLFESSGFRHTNVTSPVCSADDGGSSKKIDSMKAGIRNFCDRRKRSQSEMAGSSATLSPTWETRPPKLAKQSCIAVLPSDSHP